MHSKINFTRSSLPILKVFKSLSFFLARSATVTAKGFKFSLVTSVIILTHSLSFSILWGFKSEDISSYLFMYKSLKTLEIIDVVA